MRYKLSISVVGTDEEGEESYIFDFSNEQPELVPVYRMGRDALNSFIRWQQVEDADDSKTLADDNIGMQF